MQKLEGIGFENFRVFCDKTYFDFAPLTILTGTNSSGKSSVINGLKLLGESFRKIDNKNSSGEKRINLDALLLEPLNLSRVLERYGSLSQFLNNNSDKKEFTFSFVQTPALLGEELEFIYTVGIEDNKLRTGKIKQVEIKSLSEKKTIFKIYETTTEIGFENPKKKVIKQHAFKIDLSYFIIHCGNLLSRSLDYFKSKSKLISLLKEVDIDTLKQTIEQHNSQFNDFCAVSELDGDDDKNWQIYNIGDKFPDNVIANFDTFKSLLEDADKNLFLYDFSFLWKENPVVLTEFIQLVDSYFGNDTNKETSFQLSILEALSAVEWKGSTLDPMIDDYPSVNYDLGFRNRYEQNHAAPFSLKKYIGTIIFQDSFYSSSEDEIKQLVIDSLSRAGLKGNDFIDKVFVPLLVKLSKVSIHSSGWESTEDLYSYSSTEKFFYNDFIYNTLNLIVYPFKLIRKFSFIDAQRVQPKRIFSVNKQELLSSQINHLFALPDEEFTSCKEFLRRWIREFNIADDIDFQKDEDSPNFKIFLLKHGERPVLLADYGFGTSQILPIIIELIPRANPDIWSPYDDEYFPKYVCVEEPENSLHPALQSKLAEMFAEAVTKFNIQLIIETHSEYLIRKLQYLTAVRHHPCKLEPSDTKIYYFNHPDRIPDDEAQIRQITIKPNGMLSAEFGEGFFDESGRLMIDLLKIQNQN